LGAVRIAAQKDAKVVPVTRCRYWQPVEHLTPPAWTTVAEKGFGVPLSEDEERILQEIAQRFYEDDPSFAREVSETTLYRHTIRRMKWSVVGVIAGAVFLVLALSTSYVLSFAGFLLMLGCALVFERNLRKLGRAGIDQLSRTVKAAGLRDALGGAGRRMRDRFRNEDEEEEES
jgi:hypothetical protein